MSNVIYNDYARVYVYARMHACVPAEFRFSNDDIPPHRAFYPHTGLNLCLRLYRKTRGKAGRLWTLAGLKSEHSEIAMITGEEDQRLLSQHSS